MADSDSSRLSALRSEGDLNLSPERQAWQQDHLDDATARLIEEDARYFLHQSLSTPCLNAIQSSGGSALTDLQGRRILDFHGNSVHQVGYGHPHVVRAITEQMQTMPFCPRRYTNQPAVDLARKLCELAPGDLGKVLLAPGGTSAIGIALKLARMATGRFKTVSMWDSFHGASLDAISVGGEAIFRSDIGPLLPGTEHVPPPDAQRCPWDCGGDCSLQCARYIDYVLEKEGDVAAVVAETVRSIPYIPHLDYWKIVREACDRHGALLILDEIPHALGRTGRFFTCEHYGIVPDMVVIGKGLGGGIFPLAALIAREGLDIGGERALGHYTHEKSPVACAAALATIEVIENENLLQKTAEAGEWALRRATELSEKHPEIVDARGLGLLLGLELEVPGGTTTDHETLAEKVLYSCLSQGLSFKISRGNVLTLTPPLTISEEDFETAFRILDQALTDCRDNR